MVIPFNSSADILRALAARQISSVEVLQHFIARIEAHDGAINAVVVRDFERALTRAKAADDRRLRSSPDDLGRLHGLPLTVKESFDVAGLPTTWGVPSRTGHRASADAEAVARLAAEGAIVFGKTNVPDGLADCQTSNTLFGRTNNPWDLARTCGGSSGGSAAALAAGFTCAELGSDLAGSLRTPAHFCGVHSHKPSYGLVSQLGHSLDADSTQTDLTVIGPMARSAADLRLLLDCVAGPSGMEASAWKLVLPNSRGRRLEDFRVAVLLDHGACEVDSAISEAIMMLGRDLERAGATVDFAAAWPIDLELCWQDYMIMMRAVGSRRAPPDALRQLSDQAAALPSGDRSYRAAVRRAAGLTHHAWLALNSRRGRCREVWQRFFQSYDVVLCPVHSSLAFAHDTASAREDRTLEINGRLQDYNQSLFWLAIAGLSYLPATVRPVGLGAGLPIGIQIIGPYLEDMTTLRFAELLDQLCLPLADPLRDAAGAADESSPQPHRDHSRREACS